MDMREALYLMMRRSRKSMTQLSADIGKSRSYVHNTMNINTGDIGTQKVAAMAKQCNYKLLLVPSSTEVEGSLEIDPIS